VQGFDDTDEAFNRQRHHHDDEETRQIVSNASRGADVYPPHDLFLDNGLRHF
jgi:hypothetical protein